jgi:hypothetical protein
MLSRAILHECSRITHCRRGCLGRQGTLLDRLRSRCAILAWSLPFGTRPAYWFYFVTLGMSLAADSTKVASECHCLEGFTRYDLNMASKDHRHFWATSQRHVIDRTVRMLTYHPVFVRRPLPRDFRGFLPLPATPLMADNIEYAKAHGLDEVQDKDPQLCVLPIGGICHVVWKPAGVDASRVADTFAASPRHEVRTSPLFASSNS